MPPNVFLVEPFADQGIGTMMTAQRLAPTKTPRSHKTKLSPRHSARSIKYERNEPKNSPPYQLSINPPQSSLVFSKTNLRWWRLSVSQPRSADGLCTGDSRHGHLFRDFGRAKFFRRGIFEPWQGFFETIPKADRLYRN